MFEMRVFNYNKFYQINIHDVKFVVRLCWSETIFLKYVFGQRQYLKQSYVRYIPNMIWVHDVRN